MHQKHNYTDKYINDFTEEDTLYLQKNASGYTYTFTLQFLSFDKGVVTGKIIDLIQPNSLTGLWIGKDYYKMGVEIKGKVTKCYTYEKGLGCRWFEKDESGKYKSRLV